MAAGLGFKDFSTGEVLTAADVDGYLMQNIWVFASTAARDAAVTSPQEGNFAFTKDTNSLWYYDGAAWVASGATGDIEGVTAGIGISGGGTSGTVTVTNSMATAIDAKGDLVAGTGADTFAKLTVGANGTTLVADSAEATGLKWATPSSGGMTLISTTTLSGSTTSVSSIPSTYNSLMFVIRGMTASASGEPRFKINGSTTNHEFVGIFNGGSALETTNKNGAQMTYGNNMDETDDDNCWTLKIDNYTSSTTPKSWTFYGTYVKTTGGVAKAKIMLAGGYSLTTAVSSLDIVASSGTFSTGTILTYGVK